MKIKPACTLSASVGPIITKQQQQTNKNKNKNKQNKKQTNF